MSKSRAGLIAASGFMAVVIGMFPQALNGQAPGNGPTGPGQGKPGKVAGTVSTLAVDPGRPWGWAVKAFMEDPDRELYNTTKRKMFDGKQVFSQTITKLDVEGYCKGAAQYDFSRFEMQHTTTFRNNATYIAGKFRGNTNSSFSTGNPLAADSRYHLGVPPGKGPGAAY
jgi:hypothetical protein